MSMQTFYKRLSLKPSKAYLRRLAGLTRITRAQVLEAASEGTWLIWHAEATVA